MLSSIYHDLLYRPLLNTLVFFYNIFGDLGLAIIAITILVRLILYPVAKKSLQHQKSLKEIQPKIKALQEKHKDDKEKLTAEMMSLYKEHNFNPASGCFPLIIQFIILITLYRVFMAGFHLDSNQLYSFIPHPSDFNTHFFGTFDLSQKSLEVNFAKLFSEGGIKVLSVGGIILALVASLSQFYQTKMTIRKSLKQKELEEKLEKERPKEEKKGDQFDMTEVMNTQMLYFFPLLTFYIGVTLPAGLALYWSVSTLLLIGQQYILDRNVKRETGNE